MVAEAMHVNNSAVVAAIFGFAVGFLIKTSDYSRFRFLSLQILITRIAMTPYYRTVLFINGYYQKEQLG